MTKVKTTNSYSAILSSKNLRITDCRLKMLKVFDEAGKACSHSDIETVLGKDFDRVTLYRTFHSFTENGIIHKVPDENGIARYALCHHDEHKEHKHTDNHVHFTCTSCDSTFCFDHTEIPDVILPKGYRSSETVYLVKGKCANCPD